MKIPKIIYLAVILAIITRLVGIFSNPLLWDEASIGYNAYSILKTGKDEYGSLLPLIFKSFGDYKPGIYIYATIPFIAALGLQPFAVRLPSLIAGSFLPLIIYLLCQKISPKSKKIATIFSFLIALNPWNINFSHGAWETNLLLFEIASGLLLYFSKSYIPSALILALGLFTYQGGKFYIPIIIFYLLIFHRPAFKQIIKFLSPIFLVSLPLLYGLLFGSSSNRLQVFALWNYHRPAEEIETILRESNTLNYLTFHNNFIYFSRNFFERYFNYFSTRFLIFEGDWQIARHGPPYVGVLLLPVGLLFYLGCIIILSKKIDPLDRLFIYLLVLSPLPGALTLDIIQPVRTLPFSLPLLYFSSIGFLAVYKYFHFSKYFLGCCGFIISISLLYYFDLYHFHSIKRQPSHSLYGYQQAVSFVLKNAANHQITFTDFYGQPYIYYLFFSNYPPEKYFSQATLINQGNDVGKITSIDNIMFKVPDFNFQKNQPNQLLIFSYDDILRQNIDPKLLIPLSPINNISTFYAYIN